MGRARKKDKPHNKGRVRNPFAKAARRLALTAAFSLGAVSCASNGPKADELNPGHRIANVESLPALPPPPADSTDYHQELFRNNASNVLTPFDNLRLLRMTRSERMDFYMDKLCFTAGAQTVEGATQEQLRDAMEDLSRMTFLGKPLVELAIENDVKLCGMSQLPASVLAQYLPALDAVVAGPSGSRAGRALTMAHEIMHAAQDENGLLSYNFNWDMQSRVTRNLSVEAAAVASEYLIAFEAKLVGDNTYWSRMSFHYANGIAMKNTVEQSYNDALKAGETHEQALRAAGRAGFENVFNNTWWRDFYLDGELRSYLQDIDKGRFDNARTTGHYQFGQTKIDLAGAVGQGTSSFTQGARFPDYNGLLAGNQKMRWAFEAAEIARRGRMANNARTVESLRAQALLGGNPYLDLDIVAISREAGTKTLQPGQKFRPLFERLDDALKAQTPAPSPATAIARNPSERQHPGPS